MTALDIINQARERLGDEKKQRWSNNRLLSIVSQGQVNICLESGYLRREAVIPLVAGATRFQLPSDCYTIKRVEYLGKLLPLHTRSDQDDARVTMNSDYVAYKSNLAMDRLEIQPAIAELSLEIGYSQGESIDDNLVVTPIYGVVAISNSPSVVIEPSYGCVVSGILETDTSLPSTRYGEIAGSNLDNNVSDFDNGVYGVVTSAEYNVASDVYGCITEVERTDINGVAIPQTISGLFGITTSISYHKDTFHVYYVAIPTKLKFVNVVLDLPDIWEDILMRYVVGTALQDDNDANNLQRGEVELAKYLVQLETIKDLSSKDFSSSASDKFETNFRRI